jgi:hypothetical protein
MSAVQVAEVNRRLRALGYTVHEVPGWQTRSNGQTSAYEGGLVHHTATGYANALPGSSVGNLLVNGRSDLAGPLCNYAGNADGSFTVVAANPANHAGASGGRSMGPLPVTSLFNRRVLGLEIVYPGDQPMRDAQMRSARVWARVVADVVGRGDIERIRAHAETSVTGKWDPGFAPGRTIDMTAFRAAAKQGDDMLEDERRWLKFLNDRVAGMLRQRYLASDPATGKVGEVPAGTPGARPCTVLDSLDGNYLVGRADATDARIDALAAGMGAEIQRGLADYLTANPPTVKVELDYTALARAMNDDADYRARDNDPTTGPVS